MLSGYYGRFFKSLGYEDHEIDRMTVLCDTNPVLARKLKDYLKNKNGNGHHKKPPHKLKAKKLKSEDPRKEIWECIENLYSQYPSPITRDTKDAYEHTLQTNRKQQTNGKNKEEDGEIKKCRWCKHRPICMGVIKRGVDELSGSESTYLELCEKVEGYASQDFGKKTEWVYIEDIKNREGEIIELYEWPEQEFTGERIVRASDEMKRKAKTIYLEYIRRKGISWDGYIGEHFLKSIFNKLGLSPREEKCHTLFTLYGMKKKEIAKKLGISENTVKTLIFRAKKKFA